MFLKYNAQPSFTTSTNIVFNNSEVKEIDDKLGADLINTFIGMFEDVTPKAEPKVESKTKAKSE